jgi:hypothetical protein
LAGLHAWLVGPWRFCSKQGRQVAASMQDTRNAQGLHSRNTRSGFLHIEVPDVGNVLLGFWRKPIALRH